MACSDAIWILLREEEELEPKTAVNIFSLKIVNSGRFVE